MRIVFFGPPGAGKGTQAKLLAERHDLAHISTGRLLRKAIRAKTPTGLEAKAYIDGGQLVPGCLVRALAEEAVAEAYFDRFILDGYPRTVEQARWLMTFLEAYKAPLDAVVNLQVPAEALVVRLSGRRVNKATGENYHVEHNPPPADVDPALIVQRPDDRPAAIRRRLQVYRDETCPVLSYFQRFNLVRDVDSNAPISKVASRMEAMLASISQSWALA